MKKIIAISSLFAIYASPVSADNGAGFYAAIESGVVVLTDAGTFPNLRAISFIGGYHFSPKVTIEAENFGTYDAQNVAGTGTYVYQQNVTAISIVGTYPLSNDFGLFGKLGWNSMSTKRTLNAFAGPSSNSATTSNVLYGIGAHYYITSHFGIRGEYVYLGKSKLDSSAAGADTSRTSLGIFYDF